MKKLFAVLVALFAIAQVKAGSVDDIIANYVKAIGGADKLKSIQSIKADGKFQQAGMDFPFTIYQKRPNNFLLTTTFQGLTMKQGYDGTMGWSINPFSGRTVAEKMDADMLKQTKQQADIDGPLVDYAAKGNKVEDAGVEDIDGSPSYHLKLTTADGDLYDYYLDKDSYLIVKVKAHIKMQDGSTADGESNFSDYKEVNGVLMPFTIENVSENDGQKSSNFIKIDTVEVNTAMDDSMFKMPAADATPPNK